jgi:2-methylcitrate dehydratase PrpD
LAKHVSPSHPQTELAEFVVDLSSRDVPDVAVQRALHAMIDCLGCAIAGSKAQLVPMLRSVITTVPENHPSAAPLIGSPDHASPVDAALYNGTLAHAIDFDDITHPAYAHPTAVLLPTILSLARSTCFTGREAVMAYVIGIEVFGRLGRALNTHHYRSGWHATSTFGSIAATAAAARLLRLDLDHTRHALAIGASASSGLRANFGTMTKPLHAGYAARNGVMAALLAADGWSGNGDILGADFGFAKTFSQSGQIRWDELQRWGDGLEILSESGLALKPYPSCGATHPAIEAAILLRGDIGGRYQDIAAVDAGVPEMAFQALIHPNPKTPLQSKFSMPFVVAAALRDGDVNLQTFSEAQLDDVEIRALMPKIHMKEDARVQTSKEFACIMDMRLVDGRTLTRCVPLAIGKPSRWFSLEKLRQKFLACVADALPLPQAQVLFDAWLELAAASTLAPLIASLSSAPFASPRPHLIVQ